MIGKKAQGHVEIVISFVIFVGFLLFLFVIFNPFSQTANPKAANFIFNNLEEELEVSLMSVSVSLNKEFEEDIKNCFKIVGSGNLIHDLLEDLGCEKGKVIVRDKEDTKKAEISSSSFHIQIEKSTLSSPDNKFYTIYCSEDIIGNAVLGPCESYLNNGDFTLGIVVNRTVWSAAKLEDMKDDYKDNEKYEILRRSISGKDDFGLQVFDVEDEGIDLSTGYDWDLTDEVQDREVHAQIFPVKVLESNGELRQMKARVLVW